MVAQPIPGLEGYEPDWSQAASAAVDLRSWAQRVAKQRGVPEDVLLGVLGHESGLDPKAYGNGGGVGQFIESTARSYGTSQAELRANPRKAVELAAQLLRDNADQFSGDYDKAAAAYFIGPGNVEQASRQGGAGWLAVADQLARKYNQGTVSSYLSAVHGGYPSAGAGVSAADQPSGAAAGGVVMRAMLGEAPATTTANQPRQSVSDMLAEARDQREQELERLTEVEPLPEIGGAGDTGLGGLATLPSLDSGTSGRRASLGSSFGAALPEPSVVEPLPEQEPFRSALPPELAPLPPPAIRPPNVGDAGLAMLGQPVTDQDTGAGVGPAWGRAAAFGKPDLGVDTGVEHGPYIDEVRDYNERQYQDETNRLLDQYRTLDPSTLLQHDEMRRELIDRTGVDPDTGGAAPRGGGDLVERATQSAAQYGPRLTEVSRYDRLQALRDQWAQSQEPLPDVAAGREDIPLRSAGSLRAQLGAPMPDLGTVPQREPGQDQGLRQEITRLGGIDPATGAPVMRGTQHFGPEQPAETSPYVSVPRETKLAQLQAARAGRTDYDPAIQAALTAAPMILSGPSGGVGFALQGEAERLGLPKAVSYGVGAIPFAVPTLEGRLVSQGLGGAERATLNPSLAGRVTTQAIRNPSASALLTRAALSAPAQGGAAYLGEKVDTALGLPQVPGLGGISMLVAGAAAERGVDIGLERFAGRYRPPAPVYRQQFEPLVRQAEASVRDFSFADALNPTAAERQELAMRLGDLQDAQDLRGPAPGQNQGPKKDAGYWGARVFTDLSNPTGTALRVLKEGLTGARGPLGPLSGVRRAQEGREEERGNILGRTAMDARYGARVRADVLEVRGPKAIALIESNLRKNGTTWAEFADAQAVFEPGTPLWERPPETPSPGTQVGGDLAANLRQSVQDVRDQRAGLDTRGQMQAAQRRLTGEQNPVQPEDIAFGGERALNEGPPPGMREAPTAPGGRESLSDYVSRLDSMDIRQLRQESNRIRNAAGRGDAAMRAAALEKLDAFESLMERRQSGNYSAPGGAMGIVPGGRRREPIPQGEERIPGAPPGTHTGNLEDLVGRVMKRATDAPAQSRFWYDQGSSTINALSFGDKDRGEMITRLFALGSQDTEVMQQAGYYLKAMAGQEAGQGYFQAHRYSNTVGEKIDRYMNMSRDEFADEVARMIASEEGSTQKLGNFYLDLLDGVDPEHAAALRERTGATATMDRWMNRAFGYANDSRTPQQYAFMSKTVQTIADRLTAETGETWTPKQVQAAIWVQEMAEQNIAKAAKKGRVLTMEAALADAGGTYADSLARNRGVLLEELIPSPANPRYEAIGGLARDATPQRLAEYAMDVHKVFLDEQGRDRVAMLYNIALDPETGQPLLSAGKGGEKLGIVNPNEAARLDAYAATRARILGMDNAQWSRPFYDPAQGLHNAVDIRLPNPATDGEIEALQAALPGVNVQRSATGVHAWREATDADYAARREGARDIEKGETRTPAPKDLVDLNKATAKSIKAAAAQVWSNVDHGVLTFAMDGRKVDVNAEGLGLSTRERPDVRALESDIGDKLATVDEGFYGRERLAREQPGGASPRAPRTGAGGPSAGIVAAAPGTQPGWLVRGAHEALGALAAPLSLKSSLSPPFLRQGLARVLNNPRAATAELGRSLRAGFDDNYARQIQDSISADEWVQQTGGGPAAGQLALGGVAHPHAGRTWQDVGGQVLDWESADPDVRPEERQASASSVVGRAVERIPGQRVSSRQAAVELNLHRTNWYKEVAQRMEDAGITDKPAYEELRKTIEQFTQRGSWGQPTKFPLFFSTRAMSGRIQQAWRGVAALKHPADVFLPERFGGKPGAQQQAGRAFVSMVGANTAMLMGLYQAAALAGQDPEIEMDGKLPTLKVGHTRWDPWAGLNTPARAAIGIIADTAANPEGGLENAPQAAIQSLSRRGQKFLRGGLSPAVGIGVNTALGRDYTGQKYNLAEQVKSGALAKEGLTPFIAETIIDAAREDSPLAAAAVAGPAFLSTGINTYTTAEDKADDVAKQTFNGRKYRQLSTPEQLQVVDKLPEEHQQRIHDAKHDEYKAEREKAGWVEPEAEPKDRQETTAESKARAERNKPINEKNAKVIADDPELELQRWFFANKHGGALKNQDAVNQALALGLPDREVKYEKLDRVLSESSKITEAWKAEGEGVRNFLDDDYLTKKYAKADTPVALKNDPDYKGKTIPAFDKLPEEKQRTVLQYIRREVRQDSATLDARLAYFGYGPDSDNKRYSVHSAPASAELKRLRDTYGQEPAKKDYKFWAAY